MPRGVDTGGGGAGGTCPPQKKIMHIIYFLFANIARELILCGPPKNNAYVFLKYAYLTVFMPL